MKRLTLLGGWLLVLLLATTVTWQIVSAADDQVSQRPIAPLNVAAPVIAAQSTTTTSVPETSTSVPGETSTVSGSSSSTSSAPTTSSSTTTTTPPPTTTKANTWQTRSVKTSGGTVILRFRPGEVTYQSATPAPGFHVEVDEKGPPEVKVEFESESSKVQVSAKWDKGDLKVEISQEDED